LCTGFSCSPTYWGLHGYKSPPLVNDSHRQRGHLLSRNTLVRKTVHKELDLVVGQRATITLGTNDIRE
jgi:hypothetical protein